MDDKVREEVDELTGMLKDNLEKVVQHGKRADSIVKNMLLHSREGSGEHRLADINAIVDESLNLAYHGARAEKPNFNVTMQRSFDPAVGTADVYPQEITRVLLNLISNGFYATAKRKTEAGDGYEPTLTATTKDLGDNNRDPHPRQWHRDTGRSKSEDIQSLLHNQASGRRHRTWSVNEPRHHRETTRWQDRCGNGARAIYGIQDRTTADK